MRVHLCVLLTAFLLVGCGGGGGGGNAGVGREAYNARPVAHAGPDRSVVTGSVAVLDGSESVDDDADPLEYRWTLVSAPSGSAAKLSSSSDVAPTIVPDVVGVYAVSLVVSDGSNDSLPDTATVNSTPSPGIPVVSNLPDTGAAQYRCYGQYHETACPGAAEPYFGQDHQYITNPVDYSAGVDGTVGDNVTGLAWSMALARTDYNWYEAAGVYDAVHNPTGTDACGSVSAGGRADWRLPTVTELLSIVDYGRTAPAVGDDLAAIAQAGHYWSASEQPTDLNLFGAWRVNLAEGRTGVYRKGDWPGRVICVSGPVWGALAYTDNGDETVTDAASALTWAKAEAAGVDWRGALAYCESLVLAGHDDWRLPDIRELQSLVDTARFMPSIDERYLPSPSTYGSAVVARSYWSSTTYAGEAAGRAWTVSFDTGTTDHADKGSGGLRARCVR